MVPQGKKMPVCCRFGIFEPFGFSYTSPMRSLLKVLAPLAQSSFVGEMDIASLWRRAAPSTISMFAAQM
jgi:hypothetical protein